MVRVESKSLEDRVGSIEIICPEEVKEEEERYAPAIQNIWSQTLYEDVTRQDVHEKMQDTRNQTCFYIATVNGVPAAVTSLQIYNEPAEEGHKLHPSTQYRVRVSDQEYATTSLDHILDMDTPHGEITGLARSKQFAGQGIGSYLSSTAVQHMLETNPNMIITRFSLGYYAEGYPMAGPKSEMEYALTSNQLDPERPLPAVHPYSVPATKAAVKQGFVTVASRVDHGGPLLVHRDIAEGTSVLPMQTALYSKQQPGSYTILETGSVHATT